MTYGFKLDLRRVPNLGGIVRGGLGFGLGLFCLGLTVGGATKPDSVTIPEFRRLGILQPLGAAAEAAGIDVSGLAPLADNDGIHQGDEVTVLVTRAEGKKVEQWLINLQATRVTEEEMKRPFSTATIYSSSGRHFTFSGGRAALTLCIIGPASKGTTAPKVQRRRILVSADYLSLGLNRVPAMMLRMREQRKKDPSLPPINLSFGNRPFPAEVVAKTRAQVGFDLVTAEDERAFNGALIAMQEFLITISRTPGLQDVLQSVIDVPWWSIVTSLGKTDVGFEPLQDIRVLTAQREGLSADGRVYAWPFRLKINRRDALAFQLAVVEPRPPLAVTAGVIGIAAGHPDGKGPKLWLDVIASKQGQRD